MYIGIIFNGEGEKTKQQTNKQPQKTFPGNSRSFVLEM